VVETYEVNPSSWLIEGNIIGSELGLLQENDIFKLNNTELLTENQRKVNVDLTGITAYSSQSSHSLTRDTDVFKNIPGSAKLVSTYTGGYQDLYLIIGSPGDIAVSPNEYYYAEAYLQTIGDNYYVDMYIDWYNASEVFISSSSVSGKVFLEDEFTKNQVLAQAPGTAASAIIIFLMEDMNNGTGLYYDAGSFGDFSLGNVGLGTPEVINEETLNVIELTYGGS
jgi:hypothetical protein